MGLKRKACSLEFDSFTLPPQAQWHQQTSSHPFFQAQQPSSPPSLTSSAASPRSSSSSMDTEPFHSTLQPNHETSTSYFAAPWLHSRTRKRVRDNRPSESQIHHDTVRRLFDAQRSTQYPAEDAMMDDYLVPSFAEPHIMAYDSSDVALDSTQQMEEDYHNAALDIPEMNQRSIHDFFARQKGKEREYAIPALVVPSTMATASPLDVSELQPALKGRRSFGVLSGMNHVHNNDLEREAAIYSDAAVLSGAKATAAGHVAGGSYLPCDFRPAEMVVAMMEDAMVIG